MGVWAGQVSSEQPCLKEGNATCQRRLLRQPRLKPVLPKNGYHWPGAQVSSAMSAEVTGAAWRDQTWTGYLILCFCYEDIHLWWPLGTLQLRECWQNSSNF